MTSQILFSSFLILAIASCCVARVYNFSQYKNVKPQTDTHTSTYKFLTYGDPCESGEDNLKGHCRYSGNMICSDNKCACSDTLLVWDPKVEYLSPSGDDQDQHIIGMCVVPKGEECYADPRTPEKGGWQCLHDLACVIKPTGTMNGEPCPEDPNALCLKPGICQ